jgi:hypothetical protein
MASSTSRPNPTSDPTTLRARLTELQAKLRTALADKTSRMNDIVALCRSERRAVREELKRKRTRALEQIEYEIEAARASARHLRLSRLAEARKASDSDIAAARAAIAVERAHQDELRRIGHDQRRRRSEVHRLHELAARSGELHTALLGPFASLLQRIGSKVKPVPGESRAEAVLRYAQVHPAEAHAAAEPRAERVIEETRKEITRTKAALRSAPRAPKRPGGARGPSLPRPQPLPVVPRGAAPTPVRPTSAGRPVPPKRSAGPTPATTPGKVPAPARRPGQVPRGGGPGVPLDVLLRERDMLASKSKRPSGARGNAASRNKGPAPAKPAKKKGGGCEPPTSPPAPILTGAPLPPTLSPANEVTRERTESTVKAPEVHDTAALAKLIREDIKAEVAAKRLPPAKYSVTTDKYSMGSSITVVASKLPFPVLNEAAFHLSKWGAEFDSDRFRSRYTPEAETLQKKLEAIVGAYHWDRSDPQTDYFHSRFHKDVRLDDHGEMDRIREKLKKAAKEPSPASPGKPFIWREPPGGLLETGWYASDENNKRRGPFASQAEAERS